MAAILDGVTHSGYWKLTPDDSSPTSYYLIPKDEILLDTGGGKILLVTDPSGANIAATANANTKDHTGTEFGSLGAIAEYLELYR